MGTTLFRNWSSIECDHYSRQLQDRPQSTARLTLSACFRHRQAQIVILIVHQHYGKVSLQRGPLCKRIRSFLFSQNQPLTRTHQTQIAETAILTSYDRLHSNLTEVKEKHTKSILIWFYSFPTITDSSELVKKNL